MVPKIIECIPNSVYLLINFKLVTLTLLEDNLVMDAPFFKNLSR